VRGNMTALPSFIAAAALSGRAAGPLQGRPLESPGLGGVRFSGGCGVPSTSAAAPTECKLQSRRRAGQDGHSRVVSLQGFRRAECRAGGVCWGAETPVPLTWSSAARRAEGCRWDIGAGPGRLGEERVSAHCLGVARACCGGWAPPQPAAAAGMLPPHVWVHKPWHACAWVLHLSTHAPNASPLWLDLCSAGRAWSLQGLLEGSAVQYLSNA